MSYTTEIGWWRVSGAVALAMLSFISGRESVKCETPKYDIEWSVDWLDMTCGPEEYYILHGPTEKIWFRCDAGTQTILEVGRYND